MRIINSIFPPLPSAPAPAEALFSGRRIAAFVISLLQFAALLLIIRLLNIEKGSGISTIIPFMLAVFSITSFVPLRYRPALLFGISITVIYYAFGFVSGSALIVTALALIGCCHLPVTLWMRVALIICITAGLVALRANLFSAPRAALVVPYIASMFMFRIIVYLYELKYAKLPATLFQRLSYFFLFPNHCFLLFPIIDYKTYLKTYYDRPAADLWQKGIRWMLRGVMHLIAYRIIYYHLLIGPGDVHNLSSLLQYIICSYALILRLSGLFHFILGLLCLFGLNLPPIFNNYLLATSFVSLWRRINIYWREFMMKIFFYPIMFRYKKAIRKNLMAATMITVFAITWAMHNYQWFWIRGDFLLSPVDILFWAVLGICITANSVWLERSLGREPRAMQHAIAYPLNVLKMIGMFLFMSVMWSLWSSSSFGEWLFLFSKGKTASAPLLAIILGIFAGIIILGSLLQWLLSSGSLKKLVAIPPEHTLMLTLPAIAILLLFAYKPARDHLPAGLRDFIASIAEEKLNTTDKESNERGYYKKLIDGDNGAGGLWELSLKKPKKFTSIDEITTRTTGLLAMTFKPNARIQVNNHVIETNAFGLRDKNYDALKPAGHFRIALLGGSYEMGAGVNNSEVFEQLAEDHLNAHDTDSTVKAYEIMNFAMGGYHLVQQVELCHTRVFNYQPDAVIYVAHTNEAGRLLGFFAGSIQNGTDLKYQFLKDIKALSGVKQTMSKTEIQERLKPFIDVVIQWCYAEIAKACFEHHARPVWAFLPATADVQDNMEYEKIKAYAVRSGFVTMDLRGVYGTTDMAKLRVSEWDTHPNAAGHRLIAEKFYLEFIKNKDLIVNYKHIP